MCVYIYIHTYIHIWTTRLETLIELRLVNSSFSSSNFSIRAFRACHLAEIRQTAPCRAILGKVERFEAAASQLAAPSPPLSANLRTSIMDFRGFDSSIILILRVGIPRPIGNLPEGLSQAILVGIMLVGRLGVQCITNMDKPLEIPPNVHWTFLVNIHWTSDDPWDNTIYELNYWAQVFLDGLRIFGPAFAAAHDASLLVPLLLSLSSLLSLLLLM